MNGRTMLPRLMNEALLIWGLQEFLEVGSGGLLLPI